MQMQGTTEIRAARAEVFAFLTDPQRIGPCLPKVQSVRAHPDGTFTAEARIGKGLLSVGLALACSFTELRGPEHAAIRATGKGKGSSVDGTARMTLRELPAGGTAIDWTADVTLGGLVAKAGEARIRDAAERAVAQTFKRVRRQLKG